MLLFLAVEKFDVLYEGGCRVKKWHARLLNTLVVVSAFFPTATLLSVIQTP